MNDINDVINSYAIDLEKALKTIQQLEKENADLKSKLANIKYLDRQEVEKILNKFLCKRDTISRKKYIEGVTYDEQTAYRENHNEAITAICSLALPSFKDVIDKEKIVKVLQKHQDYFGKFNRMGIRGTPESLATEIIKEINE